LAHADENVSEMLEYVPATFVVIRHVRAKLSCTKCDCIVQAEAPTEPPPSSAAPPARAVGTRAGFEILASRLQSKARQSSSSSQAIVESSRISVVLHRARKGDNP
jgi:transposase